MTNTTRRTFLQTSAAVGAVASAAGLSRGQALAATPAPPVVKLSWLGDQAPRVPSEVSWGVPWPRGALPKSRKVTVRSASGAAVPTQSWTMAYWPDGSVKWTGLAIAADAGMAGPLSVAVGAAPAAPPTAVRVTEGPQFIEIATGPLRCRIARTGADLIETLAVDGREVARNGRLIVLREDRSAYETSRTTREEAFESRVSKVTVEQSGPVRVVVRIEGTHAAASGTRQWLPFTVRLYFTAGLASIRMVHTFVVDADQATDFIRGIGLAFTVPFREETQNRHVRFATDNDGLFSEPVLLSPGYRARATEADAERERAQMAGRRIPNLAQLTQAERTNFADSAVWDSFKLTQLGPDSFAIRKRTNAASSWTQITNGLRARGLVFLGDVSGGLAVGVKRFWQKYPSALEVSGGAAAAGELKVWFWSPDAPAMDLRHYDTVGHAQSVSYEDYQEGHATPEGVANTSELTLWATANTPDPATLDAMAKTAIEPPLLICDPQHYYDTHTLGVWSLPGQPTPGLTAAEVASADTQLDRMFTFFEGEIDRRRWYGFWDFGDLRRTYDPIRREWMYDIGGHGWNATELFPEVWLWHAFLRSGRADIFRMAENMIRNVTEVDVHHAGRFAGLGSRHNVSHWGDGAKESRINQALHKRFYYYLTTDERMGDLIREPLAVMEKAISDFPPLRKVIPRPDIQAPQAFIRIGPDWLALASNWMAEWERTGDVRYRDYIRTGMRDLGAMADAWLQRVTFKFDPATKHLIDVGERSNAPSHFMFVFGGDHIAMELMQLIDVPEFVVAWNRLCEMFARRTPGSPYFQTRITAYAASTTRDPALRNRALELIRGDLKFNGGDYIPATLPVYEGPMATSRVVEVPGRSSFTPATAVPEVAQWALNLMTAPEHLRALESGVPAWRKF